MSGFANFNAAFPTQGGTPGGMLPSQQQQRTMNVAPMTMVPQRSSMGGPGLGLPSAPLTGQTAHQLGLKPAEKALFDHLFYSCDGARASGTVSGGAIKSLFTASRLPKPSLAQVWSLSDRQRRKVLDQEDFYVACRLIAIAQQNLPITYQSLNAYTDLPLPQFDGVAMPQQMQQQQQQPAGMMPGGAPGGMPMMQGMPQQQQMPGQMMAAQLLPNQQLQQQQQQQQVRRNAPPMTTAGPGLNSVPLGPALGQANRGMDLMGATALGSAPGPAGAASFPVSMGRQAAPLSGGAPGGPIPSAAAGGLSDADWTISDMERAKYVSLFSSADADGDGFVGGKEANLFFKQSGLDNATLKQIWLLSDVDRDNKLNPDEFAVAMHLTLHVRKKQPLPPVLPPSMDPRNLPHRQQPQNAGLPLMGANAPMPQQMQQQQQPLMGAPAPAAAGGKLNLDFLPDVLPSPAQSAAPPSLAPPVAAPSAPAADLMSFDGGLSAGASAGGMANASGSNSARSSRPASRRASTVIDDFGFGAPAATPQAQFMPQQQQQPSFASMNGLTLNTGVTPVNSHAALPESKHALIDATQALEDRTAQLHSVSAAVDSARRASSASDSRLEAKLREVAEVNDKIAAQEKLLEEQRSHVAGVEAQHAQAEQQLQEAKKRLADSQDLLRTGDSRAKALADETLSMKREASELDMQVTLLESQLQSLRSSLKGVEELKETQAGILAARRDQHARLLHEKAQLSELLSQSKLALAQMKEEANIIKAGLQAQQEGVDEMHQLLQEHQAIVREEKLKPSPKAAMWATPSPAPAMSSPASAAAAKSAASPAAISPATAQASTGGSPAAATTAAPSSTSSSAKAKAKAAFSFGGEDEDDAYNLDDIQLPTLGASTTIAAAEPATTAPAASPASAAAVPPPAEPPAPVPVPQGRVAAARASFDAKMHEEWSKPVPEPDEPKPAAASAAPEAAAAAEPKGHHVSTASVAFQSQSDIAGGPAAPSSLQLASPHSGASGASPLSASSMASPPPPAVPTFPSALQGTGVPDPFGDSDGASGNPWDDPFGPPSSVGASAPAGASGAATTGSDPAASLSPSAAAVFGEESDPFGFDAPAAATTSTTLPAGAATSSSNPFGGEDDPFGAPAAPLAAGAAGASAPAADDFGSFDDFGADFGQSPPANTDAPAKSPVADVPAATAASDSVASPVAAAASPAASPAPPAEAPAPSPADKKAVASANFAAAMEDDWAAFD